MKTVNKHTQHSSIFVENISAFPFQRYYDTTLVENARGQAQELYGLGNVNVESTGKTTLDPCVPGIILVDSIEQEERYYGQGDQYHVRRLPCPIKILRYLKNFKIQFKFYQQNVHLQSISYHCLIMKVPLGIDLLQLFLTDYVNPVDKDNCILTGIQEKINWIGYETDFRWVKGNQRTGPSKYIIGSLFLPYQVQNQYYQTEIEIPEEIELYSNERIICLLLSYDLSTQYTETIMPVDPYDGGSHPVDLGHYGYFSGHVSYDIYF